MTGNIDGIHGALLGQSGLNRHLNCSQDSLIQRAARFCGCHKDWDYLGVELALYFIKECRDLCALSRRTASGIRKEGLPLEPHAKIEIGTLRHRGKPIAFQLKSENGNSGHVNRRADVCGSKA
jgi:hypothetical protein